MSNELIEIANELIEKSKQIQKLLSDKIDEIEQHHKKLNTARTVGTTVSSVGAVTTIVGVGLSFFTGGLSLVAAAGVGSVLLLSGGTVSLGAELVDVYASSKFLKQIDSICAQRDEASKKFNEKLREIEEARVKLVELGFADDDAFGIAVRYGQAAYGVGLSLFNGYKILKSSRSLTSFSLRTGGKVWKSIRLFSNGITKAFRHIGIDVTKKVSMQIAKSSAIALNLVFVIWDVTVLIQSWKTNHPTTKEVVKLVENLENEMSDLRKFVDELSKASLDFDVDFNSDFNKDENPCE